MQQQQARPYLMYLATLSVAGMLTLGGAARLTAGDAQLSDPSLDQLRNAYNMAGCSTGGGDWGEDAGECYYFSGDGNSCWWEGPGGGTWTEDSSGDSWSEEYNGCEANLAMGGSGFQAIFQDL